MSTTAIILIISMILALVATCVAMPWAIKYALSHSLIDLPDERKIHTGSIPRIGGVVFVPVAVLCAVVATASLVLNNPIIAMGYTMGDLALQLLAVVFLFVAGTIDDIVGLRYRVKFIVQFIAGALLCASGLYVSNLHGVLGIYEIPAFVGWAITIFAVIYCTNALNLIDGVDGQASLIAMTAFGYYYLYMCRHLDLLYTPLCLMFIMTLMGFFFFNVFGSPERRTKTFMGDAGSLSLGFVIVMLAIACCKYVSVSPQGFDGAFVRAFAPMFVPCMDVVRVVARRLRTGHNPFEADRNHIHHKLLSGGLTAHQVTATVVTINACYIALSVWLAQYMNVNLVIFTVFTLWTVMNVVITNIIKRSKTKTRHNEQIQ